MNKLSKLSEKEKKIIHYGILILIIISIFTQSYEAYKIYKDRGFDYCVKEENKLNNSFKFHCFGTKKELKSWLNNYQNNIKRDNFGANNYLNNYSNISFID
jgi:hypothetical protein